MLVGGAIVLIALVVAIVAGVAKSNSGMNPDDELIALEGGACIVAALAMAITLSLAAGFYINNRK
jgi:hypothetical protein